MTAAVAYDISKKPGEWVSARSERESLRVLLLFAAVFGALIAAGAALWAGERIVALFAVVVALLIMKFFLDEKIEAALRWMKGANAEVAVGKELDELRRERYVVMHDIDQPGEGNIDHLVSGPTGVFLVDSKYGWYRDDAPRKAKRQAAKLNRELGVWVTPVICRVKAKGGTSRHQDVAVVPRAEIVAWIKAQNKPPLDFDRLARWADGL